MDGKMEDRIKRQLKKYYQNIIQRIEDADRIYIFGLGEAKIKLRKKIEKKKAFASKKLDAETADKMTGRTNHCPGAGILCTVSLRACGRPDHEPVNPAQIGVAADAAVNMSSTFAMAGRSPGGIGIIFHYLSRRFEIIRSSLWVSG